MGTATTLGLEIGAGELSGGRMQRRIQIIFDPYALLQIKSKEYDNHISLSKGNEIDIIYVDYYITNIIINIVIVIIIIIIIIFMQLFTIVLLLIIIIIIILSGLNP